jgi:hypothetical protein
VTEDDREKGARALLRRVKQDFSQLFSKEYNRRFFRTHMEVLDVDYLVALAREGDKDALEILRKHAHGARRAGMCVPASLHEFVWEIFIDGPPKAKSGTSPKDTDLKYQTFRVLAKILNKDYGFSTYRSVEHRGEKSGPLSCCLLIAQEFGLDERRVEEIILGDGKAGVLSH